ncbi:maltooligosyl trehalose synthase [candidate division WOR-1 bacterium DG_54_3]|uniref:Maltooligosyl trehalose synthase n=1 Tax=candidate division WOR-1 bacterium DG_54_3 TaxID=1703775 RepID=A0A0S7Y4A0_UNCSA|nr:MAG: maltooligosyl trehalose synthase [candidate division WOR-1 bacterium DG_54_3]
MSVPLATYRLQFNPDFGFQAAQKIAPYLADLGISCIYASPIFKARPGSSHGYDIVDPNQLNPDLGSAQEFDQLIKQTRSLGLSWLQDVVPNHLAFDGENRYLLDVLEKGRNSRYYKFFDITWDHPQEDLKGRVLAPFLGRFYSEALESGEIKLSLDEQGLSIRYHNWRFPVRPESRDRFFPEKLDEESVARFNGEPGKPESFNELDRLISDQLYRLSFWKVATEEINYRRFFNINELICLRAEDKEVFEAMHELVFRLVREEKFDGLRIDHIDGLYDPEVYLKRLREKVGDLYLIAEKILDPVEELPKSWPIQGTTGYDFLNLVNGLFCRQDAGKEFAKLYYKFTGIHLPYDELLAAKKRLIIGKHMAGNIDSLAREMKYISSGDRYGRDITLYGLRRGLVEVMAYFPVYRTYINYESFTDQDRKFIQQATEMARLRNPGLLYEIDYIQKFLLREFELGTDFKQKGVDFIMKFQQYTGPLMAKGFEDTFLYIYNKLISLNEVGGNPNSFGTGLKDFHRFSARRSALYPYALNATSTHDTKRGEDVRARINVLTELAKEWKNSLKVWSRLNKARKTIRNGTYLPDANDEYFLYQTMLGAWPFNEGEIENFKQRLKEYMVKAVREAKVHTAWLKPDTEYENACLKFIDEICRPAEDNRFLKEFLAFQKKIAFYGIFNSLSQLLLKITNPGVPDFYQGTELWDLNLVDPDNRRPVDFALRQRLLEEIKEKEKDKEKVLSFINEMLMNKEDGRVKMFLMCRVLKARKEQLGVFEQGEYLPLKVKGKYKDHVIAFARRDKKSWVVAIAPRFFASLIKEGQAPIGPQVWEDTEVLLPPAAPKRWSEKISGQDLAFERRIALGSALSVFPVGLLSGER